MMRNLARLFFGLKRFFLKNRLLLLGFCLLVISVLAGFFAIERGYRNWFVAYPFLTAKADYYFQMDLDRDSTYLPRVLASVNSRSGLNNEEVLFELFSAALALEGDQIGLFREESTLYLFVRNAQSLPSPEIYVFKQFDFNQHRYTIFGINEWVQAEPTLWDNFSDLYTASKIQADSAGLIYTQNPMSIFVRIDSSGSNLEFDFSSQHKNLGKDNSNKMQPEGQFFIGKEAEVQLPNFEVSQNLSQSISKNRAQMFISRGSIEDFFKNPYQKDLSWQINLQVSLENAQQVVDLTLEELSKLYPQAVERTLPDNTTVFELRRDQRQFLIEGTLNLNDKPEGVITFINDQIVYKYADGVLTLVKGDVDITKSVDNSCNFADSLVAGYYSSQPALEMVWKKLFFSLNQQRMRLCFSLE